MPQEQADLHTSIILITVTFLIIVIGLIVLVATYYRKRGNHLKEKKQLSQKFEAEIMKTQIEVQEQTMQTIASNLHDNIGQLLSLTNLTLGSIDISNTEKAENKIATSVELINKSIKELRELAKLLQGEQLLQRGIAYALEQEINWLKRIEAYHIEFKNEMEDSEVKSPEKDLIVLRLFQEIINNIIKHAQASHIAICLTLKNKHLHLGITENGIGFNYDEIKNKSNGLGLYSIEQRVKLIKGRFQLESVIGKGTQINIAIPYI